MQLTVIDINGTPHIFEGEDKLPNFDILARCSGQRHMVLASNEGDLFDPTNPQNQINKPDKERGGKFYRLHSCSQLCYVQYVTFLRSKNRTHHILAQRRFRNDYV